MLKLEINYDTKTFEYDLEFSLFSRHKINLDIASLSLAILLQKKFKVDNFLAHLKKHEVKRNNA